MIALVALAALTATLPAPRTLYTIDAHVPDDLATIEGTVVIDAVNDSGARIDSLTLWLYPQAFAGHLAGITGITEPLYQPWGNGQGGITVTELRVAGAPAEGLPLPLPDAPPGTARTLALPRSLAPGEQVQVSMRFLVQVPHRLGPLARAKGVLTALGGFHPFVTPGKPQGGDERRRLPSPADFDLRLTLPVGYRALAGGQEVAAGPLHLERRAYLDLFVRPTSVEPLPAGDGQVFPLDRDPGGSGADTGGLPYPPELASAWNGDELQALVRRLSRWADRRLLPAEGPIDLVVVPLRSELAIFTPGAVAVSDRAYALPPWPAARHFHDKAVARAWLARRLLPMVQRIEAPEDVRTVADVLGSYLADRFQEEAHQTPGDLHGLLSDLDFVPGVDDFLRSPKSAFAHVYLQPVAEPIPVRDEPWTFAVVAPRGRLLKEKLADWMGEPGLTRAIDIYLARAPECPERAPGPGVGPCALQRAVETVMGRDMSVFFEAWARTIPSEDVRVSLAVTPVPGGFQARIAVWRVGDTPPEVIEVGARDAEGRRYLLVWRAGAGESRKEFEVRTVSPIDWLRVDPRDRVYQSPQEAGEVAEKGDDIPAKLQYLVTYATIAYHASDQTFSGGGGLIIRQRENLSRRLLFTGSFDASQVGGSVDLVLGFGSLIDASRFPHNLGLGFGADYLRQGFGGGEEGFVMGPRLSYLYDDRPPVPEPRAGMAFGAGLGLQLGAVSGTGSAAYPAATAALVRLFPLGSQSSLAARIKGGIVGHGTPAQQLIALGGTDSSLRGFSLGEVLSEREAVLSFEWRHPLLRDVDVDLAFVRLRGIRGALFADGALTAYVQRPGPTGLIRDPAIQPFADIGYGIDLIYDFLGVRPLVVGLDVGIPFGRLPESQGFSPVTITFRATQAFTGL